jgi:hypothetical protein
MGRFSFQASKATKILNFVSCFSERVPIDSAWGTDSFPACGFGSNWDASFKIFKK